MLYKTKSKRYTTSSGESRDVLRYEKEGRALTRS
jgi:hypothetical protein